MTPTARTLSTPAAEPFGTFHAALCGLDGGAESIEGTQQAALLCRPGTHLGLVTLPPGPEAAARHLLERGERCDLLVVSAGHPAAGAVVEAAAVSVLTARRPPAGAFGDSVLVAVDAGPSCLAAAEAAGRLAARRGGRTAVVAAPGHDDATRGILAEVVQRLTAITGTAPVVLDESGSAPRAVAAAARAVEATLVATGSRGPHAQDSTSLRIAESAPCSVLVCRA